MPMSLNPQNLSHHSGQHPAQAAGDAQSVPASVRGAMDLGAGANSAPAAEASQSASAPSAGPGRFRRDIADPQQFQAVAELSSQVPVVLVLTAGYAPESGQFADQLAAQIDQLDGRMVLSGVDVEKVPEIAQALQAQSIPTVVALIGGRPVPIAQSAIPMDQVGPVLQELLSLAQQNGVSGQVEPTAEQSEPEPLPPLHQEAVDKLEAGDLDGAHAAYEQAIRENPGDTQAKLAMAQVELLQRVTVMDAQAVRDAAAASPDDLKAQLDVADLDLSGGHVEDAFRRLLNLVRRTAGEDRETVRKRLIDLFGVVGAEDPRVVAARSQLMRALF
ncbi:tetratricopeptide repeat protein [Kocuria subflava]|uniref:Tetratricopeptide repeat protein n=2 Tax=Micrococcaceae TaxID=1268 RepID=A0A846TTW0_9MICC|nr:tetratricopeptide repeat protein [Kocuria subflava]